MKVRNVLATAAALTAMAGFATTTTSAVALAPAAVAVPHFDCASCASITDALAKANQAIDAALRLLDQVSALPTTPVVPTLPLVPPSPCKSDCKAEVTTPQGAEDFALGISRHVIDKLPAGACVNSGCEFALPPGLPPFP
jgi:hypothetical protein